MANSGASAATTPPSKGRSLQAQFAALLAASPQDSHSGAKEKEHRDGPSTPDVLADTGEPVAVPPPLIELEGFDEPDLLPPPDQGVGLPPARRRSFLAQLRGLQPRMLAQKAVSREPSAKAELDPAEAVVETGRVSLRGQLPPLRHFLAPLRVVRPAAAPAKAAPIVVPKLAVAAPAAAVDTDAEAKLDTQVKLDTEAGPQRSGLQQLLVRRRTSAQQWRDTVLHRLHDRQQLVYWGRWVAVAVIAIVVVGVAAPRLLHRSANRSLAPLANAPSDPAQRFTYFKRGADAGDPDAELQLGILYAKGEGVTQDYATAATWFRAAAEQGLARAQYDLGVLYDRGRGVTADPNQATNWYRKAAEGKYPLAEYNLAVAYTKGDGIRKDVAEAALWYRRAAGQGVVQAMVNLGMLYERGEGVPVSQVDAYAWYLAAGRRGNQPAAPRADDLFGGLSQLEQVRAQVLAGDVAGSIHDPAPEAPVGG
jgi:hypothetical protein